jgi:UDP-N-acetyl-D-mannosaminuronic acid transferase (WecB/TagA/CpsF family)
MDVASLGIGMIPEPVAMGVSAGLDVISGVGNEATMWWRVRKLLERVNPEIWHPRRLEMKVIKDTELTGLLGVDRNKLLMDLYVFPRWEKATFC